MKPCVYGLVDPRTKILRYIGKDEDGVGRKEAHLNPKETAARKSHCASWLKSLFREGLKPDYVVLEETSSIDELNLAEQFWIMYHRDIGTPLTNHREGGTGGNLDDVACRKLKEIANKPESRKQRSESMLRFWSNPQQKEERITANIRSHNTPDYKEKASRIQKEVQNRPEVVAHRNAAINRPEVKFKKSEGMKRVWQIRKAGRQETPRSEQQATDGHQQVANSAGHLSPGTVGTDGGAGGARTPQQEDQG